MAPNFVKICPFLYWGSFCPHCPLNLEKFSKMNSEFEFSTPKLFMAPSFINNLTIFVLVGVINPCAKIQLDIRREESWPWHNSTKIATERPPRLIFSRKPLGVKWFSKNRILIFRRIFFLRMVIEILSNYTYKVILHYSNVYLVRAQGFSRLIGPRRLGAGRVYFPKTSWCKIIRH